DGMCLDAKGAVWVSTGGNAIVRVAAGGQVLQHVELSESRAPFALMLGGPDRRTLFILTAEWRGADGIASNLDRLANRPRTGQVLTLPVEVPGAGRPSAAPAEHAGRQPVAYRAQASGWEPSISVKPYSRASWAAVTDCWFQRARPGSAARAATARPAQRIAIRRPPGTTLRGHHWRDPPGPWTEGE